eukprot:1416029-Lingulodinium_polyedra.AAC.1
MPWGEGATYYAVCAFRKSNAPRGAYVPQLLFSMAFVAPAQVTFLGREHGVPVRRPSFRQELSREASPMTCARA